MGKIHRQSNHLVINGALQSQIESRILTGHEATAPADALGAGQTNDALHVEGAPEAPNCRAGFFGARESFDAFERDVLPQLFADKDAGSPLRIWCVDCGTGEEAFSRHRPTGIDLSGPVSIAFTARRGTPAATRVVSAC